MPGTGSPQLVQPGNEEPSTVNEKLKRKVEELTRTNKDLQNLLSSTNIATILLDSDLRIKCYTPSSLSLFDIIPGDLGQSLSDLSCGLDYPEIAADTQRVLQHLTPSEREVAHHDGRVFLARILPDCTTEDEVTGAVLTFIDITEQKHAQKNERWLAAIVNWSEDAIISCTTEGTIISWNPGAERVFGYSADEVIAQEITLLIAPHSADEQQRIAQAIRFGGSMVNHEALCLRKGGGPPITVALTVSPIKAGSGEILGVTALARDITASKSAHERLRTSEERLRLMIENISEYAFFSTDPDRRVTYWNAGAERLLGYSESEILGQMADVIFTPEDRASGGVESELAQALAQGRAVDERWHLRKDGTRFWGSGALMPMRDAGGQVVIGFVKVLRDQTEALLAHKALEQSRADLWQALQETERSRLEAEAAARAKDHFLAVLSHELRTPLTPVLMAVSALVRQNLPEPAAEALEMIRRNVQLEAHFIDDLLDLTRISRGKIELVREMMDVHVALRRAIEVSEADLQGKQQRLTVLLEAAEHSLEGDFARLQQAFWNLLKNASKFTPEQGRIDVRSRNEGGNLVIEIADSGSGIDPVALPRIFDAFVQADHSASQEFGGLGLGLAIVKATIEAHKGKVSARSEGRGRGSIFTVELPLDAEKA